MSSFIPQTLSSDSVWAMTEQAQSATCCLIFEKRKWNEDDDGPASRLNWAGCRQTSEAAEFETDWTCEITSEKHFLFKHENCYWDESKLFIFSVLQEETHYRLGHVSCLQEVNVSRVLGYDIKISLLPDSVHASPIILCSISVKHLVNCFWINALIAIIHLVKYLILFFMVECFHTVKLSQSANIND